MTRPAKPDYVNEMLFLIAVMMVRLNAAFFFAFEALCGSCQQTFFDGVRNSDTSSRQHSRMINVSIAPFLFVTLVPFADFFRMGHSILSVFRTVFIGIQRSPFFVVGAPFLDVCISHTTILA